MIENTNYYWNLINRAQMGQKKPFLELAGFYKNMVYQHALRLNGDVGYAEKVTNDVFIKAWQHIKYLTANSPFNLWLNGLTVSISASFHQLKNKTEFSTKHNDLVLANEFDKVFINLSDTQRLLLVLHDLEGYSIADCSIMLNENKLNALANDLDNARTKFLSTKTTSLLNSYPEESWRKITQDFEYWISEIKSDEELSEDLVALKNYRQILSNFLSKNKPKENLLNGLTSILSDESRNDELNRKQENSRLAKAANSAVANTSILTDEAAEIFSNPEDAKEQFSEKLNLVKKQKKIVSNLSYLLICMNAIVLFFVFGNLYQNATWEATSKSKITALNSNSSISSLGISDIVETNINEAREIKIHSVGHITLKSNSKIKVINCETEDNVLELLNGKIELNTTTFSNRFSILISDYTIRDFGSISSISYSPNSGINNIEVAKGSLIAVNNEKIIPIPENYCYNIGELSSFRKDVSATIKNIIKNLESPIILDNSLNYLLENSIKKDGILLWVLLNNADHLTNKTILNKITHFFDLPKNVTEAGLLNGNVKMMINLLEYIEWQI